MKELSKPISVSLPIKTGQSLKIEVEDGQVRAGLVKKSGKVALDLLEIGVPKSFGKLTLVRSGNDTLRITDASGAQREITLADLKGTASDAEQHVLRSFALGLSQAGQSVGAPELKSDRPKVQALLDGGFAQQLAQLVKGEAAVRLDQLPDAYTRLKHMELLPEERARLLALPELMRAPGADWSALYEEQQTLQKKESSPEDLRELRALILAQLQAADLPKGVEQALLAHELVTKETPSHEDLLRLLSGELFLPRASGAIAKNIEKAAAGKVWIEGSQTPSPYHAEAAASFVAELGERIAPEARGYWIAALTLFHDALEFRGPRSAEAKLILLERLGAQTLAQLHSRFDHKGDGGLYAEYMIAGYTLAHPKGVKSLKEHLAVSDTELITHGAYGFNSLGRSENVHELPGFTPEVVDKLLKGLRFGDFLKLVDAAWDAGFQGLLAKEGVAGVIALAKKKSKAELVELAKAAKVDGPKIYEAKMPAADPALVAKVQPLPLAEIKKLADDVREGALSREQAAELHAIVEKYLVPDRFGHTNVRHYSQADLLQFWSSISDLGPVVPTAEHLGVLRTLNARPGQIAHQMRDLLALGARGEIITSFLAAAKAKAGSTAALGCLAHALKQTNAEVPSMGERYQRLLDGFGDEKTRFKYLFSNPSTVAGLLEVMADPNADAKALSQAMNQVEVPYRSLETQVWDNGSAHTLKTSVQLGGGALDTELTVRTPHGELMVRVKLPGQPQHGHGDFAEIQTFGDGGARFNFGPPVQAGSNQAAELIGARIFAEALARGAEHALRERPAGGLDDWHRGQLEQTLARAAIELGRLPKAELHTAYGEGAIKTPAEAFAAIANAIGYQIEAKDLGPSEVKVVLAQIYASKMANLLDPEKHSRSFSDRDGVKLMANAFEVMSALPEASRHLGDPSPAQTLSRIAELAGYPVPKDMKQAGAWDTLHAHMLSSALAEQADHWLWTLKHYPERNLEPTLDKLAAIADKLIVLSPEALAETPPGAKRSTHELLKALAESAQLASDGSARGILDALRARPNRIAVSSWLEDPFELGSQVYLSPS